jgi:hypothetical protein
LHFLLQALRSGESNMVSHCWGDKDFDWDSLYKAEQLGNKLMKSLGRIGVRSKEKFGSLRWDLHFFDGTLHSLTHPGYVYSQYPKWLWEFDVVYRPLRFLLPVIQAWQAFVVKCTFWYICRKFPHIEKEIILDAPRELLTTRLKKLAGSMWKTTCKSCEKWYTCDNEVCPHCGGEK